MHLLGCGVLLCSQGCQPVALQQPELDSWCIHITKPPAMQSGLSVSASELRCWSCLRTTMPFQCYWAGGPTLQQRLTLALWYVLPPHILDKPWLC